MAANLAKGVILLKFSLMLDSNYWNGRYQHGQTGWDIGEASPPIIEFVSGVEDRSIPVLIPGCGNAHEAEWMLDNGFTDITLLDFAATPLDNIRQRLGDRKELKLVHGNFFDHEGEYGLILEQTFFCALHPAQRGDYMEKMASLLHPEGVLAGVLFNVEFEKDGPPFGGSEEEYRKLMHPHLSIVTMKPCLNSIQPRMNSELFFIVRPATVNS